MCPIASPVKNLRPLLKEKEAPTPAKESTAGPGVIMRKKTAKPKASIMSQKLRLLKLECRQKVCRHYPPKLSHKLALYDSNDTLTRKNLKEKYKNYFLDMYLDFKKRKPGP